MFAPVSADVKHEWTFYHNHRQRAIAKRPSGQPDFADKSTLQGLTAPP
jgi:hypothetical protein